MVEARESMWKVLAGCHTERPEDRRNSWIATGLLLLWAIAFGLASFSLKRDWIPAGAASYLVALVPIALSIVATRAYMRFITRADELLRKIQLEALAFGFGGGFVATFTLDLAEKVGYGPFDISTPLLAMVACWVIGFLAALRRYA